MAAELIATTATKKVYRDGDKAIKVFNADFPKAEVLNEALITARVEETGGIDVPKVLEVGVFEGKWSITFDFIEGKTLQQLMDENPDKLAEYMEQMVDLHLNILSKHCPLLNKLKDKMEHKQAMIETINFAFPTILTSGTIMTVSGLLIGRMTSDACIVGIGQCLGRGTIISILLVLFVLPQILLIGTRIVDRTSFAVPKLVARSSGNGRMRVNGIVQGEIHGSVAGTMNAIVDGDVQLTVISGNVSQELDDNEKQEVQNEDQ